MKSLILRSLLAAIALYFWGFIYFAISGVPNKFLGQTDDIGPMLDTALPASGTYFIPNHEEEEKAMELMKRGPVATIHYHKGGVTPMGAKTMVGGFFHGWVVCLVLALLIRCFAADKPLGARLIFALLVGLAGAVMTRLGDAIWWHYPLGWQLSNIFYHLVSFVLIGLVLGKLSTDTAAE
jgi:hypothetical protein